MTAVDSAAVLGDLRRARRKQRVASIHWIDALYQVYVTGIVSVVVIVLLSGAVGDGKVAPQTLADVKAHGPALVGLLAALAVLAGLRSGSRGGPLALEKADVRHVLLSPVDRGVALRGPAWRQLRFLSTVGLAVGAVAGQLAVRRLPGNPAEWMAVGALFMVGVVWLGFGSALVASGTSLPSWAATGIGGLLVAWSVGDLTGDLPTAPASIAGRLALWPLHLDLWGLVGPVLGAVLVVIGMRSVEHVSLEAAERRTALVGQMRFAVTLQDLRTVMVLRRQLAQETPRSRPWVPGLRRSPRFPVWHRGVRSLARWPLDRIVRVLALAVVAGLALRGAWAGTTPLIILAGLALWVAALDAAEPLGQEVDHPSRTESFPVARGQIFVLHLPIVLVVSSAIGLLAGAVAAVPLGDPPPLGVALVAAACAGLLAAAGATVSIVQGAPDPVTDQIIAVQPEIAGVRTVYRTAFPPALAVLGTLPLLAGRASVRGIGDPPAFAATVNAAAALVAVVVVLVAGWVRFRDQIRTAMANATDQLSPSKIAERQREERLAAEERERDALAESRRLAGRGDDDARPASARAKQRQSGKSSPSKPAETPEGFRGGTSAKPIGRKRDQR